MKTYRVPVFNLEFDSATVKATNEVDAREKVQKSLDDGTFWAMNEGAWRGEVWEIDKEAIEEVTS